MATGGQGWKAIALDEIEAVPWRDTELVWRPVRGALDLLPDGRHCFEFREPSWFCDPVYDLLRAHGVALAIGDHPERPWQPFVLTTDWTYVRFHYGRRGRRGNYSDTELREWADRLADAAAGAEVLAYFNNDWEGFAVRNALRLRDLLQRAGGAVGPRL